MNEAAGLPIMPGDWVRLWHRDYPGFELVGIVRSGVSSSLEVALTFIGDNGKVDAGYVLKEHRRPTGKGMVTLNPTFRALQAMTRDNLRRAEENLTTAQEGLAGASNDLVRTLYERAVKSAEEFLAACQESYESAWEGCIDFTRPPKQ